MTLADVQLDLVHARRADWIAVVVFVHDSCRLFEQVDCGDPGGDILNVDYGLAGEVNFVLDHSDRYVLFILLRMMTGLMQLVDRDLVFILFFFRQANRVDKADCITIFDLLVSLLHNELLAMRLAEQSKHWPFQVFRCYGKDSCFSTCLWLAAQLRSLQQATGLL